MSVLGVGSSALAGVGGRAWGQSGYRGLPLSIPLACCQRGPFCVHGPCSAPTVPVTFPQPSKQKRKFSSFFKSLVIELDKDLYGPDNHLVEVRQVVSALESPPSRLPKAPKKLQIWTEDPPKVLSPINPDGSAGDLAPPPPPRDSGIGHLQPRRQMDSK